jgi:RNA polymerase sigma-70 factor, ECF subfamily
MAYAMAIGMGLPLVDSKTGGGAPLRPMDESKFEAFYKQTAAGLWSYVYRLTGNASTSDDLVQKAFFHFIRAKPLVASDEHMRRYLYRTATNLAFDHFRESKRHNDTSLDAVSNRAVSGEPSAAAQLRHDMARVFGDLKPRERALLWLAHVEELSHEQLAEALGLKTKSVKVLLFRARKKLAELCTKRGLGPEALR